MSTLRPPDQKTHANVVLWLDDARSEYHSGLKVFNFGDVAAGDKPTTLKLVDIPVFRSGTFRDSMGDQHTWEPLHIDLMVANFDILKGRSIFADVPVRHGHPSFLGLGFSGEVVGYHEALRAEDRVNPVDGQTYRYLLATYTVLGADNVEKASNGLWRNRSAEVGTFITNSEAEFWPVYQGVAYVDIPAVEGLTGFAKDRGLGSQFSIMTTTKEAPVGEQNNDTTTTAPAAPAAPAAPVPAAPPAAPAAPAAPATETTEHGKGQAFTFKIGGQPTTDFGRVQQHIDALETAQDESKQAARAAFCKGLADQGKIMAPKLAEVEAFAKELSDTAYTAWQATMEAVPAGPLFSQHGAGNEGNTNHQQGGADGKLSEKERLEAIVNYNKQGGMSQRELEQTPSYKALQALNASAPRA